MSKKTFNPADWTETNKTESKATANNKPVQSTNPIPPLGGGSEGSDIETITQRIESSSVDIAPNYADWRDLGFALADELGESGRAYYHRLSRFYQDYNSTEADKQFDACLKAHGNGVSIKTFYHLA
ncbi:MAG: PriCT-2 domain-containing protein, partial [Candidatus Paceibacterota bacterium]